MASNFRQFDAAYNVFDEGGPAHRKVDYFAIQTLGGTNTDTVVSSNPFTQLAADDTIQIKSSAAGDNTQWVTIAFIDTSNKLQVTITKLNGVAAVTVDGTSGDLCRYFERAYLSAKAAGTITIERDNGVLITTITIGHMGTEIIHKFCRGLKGELECFVHYIEFYLGSLYNNDVTGELRMFPDASQARDVTVGYQRLYGGKTDRADTTMGWAKRWEGPRRSFPGGYIALVANDGGDWTQVRAQMEISANSME